MNPPKIANLYGRLIALGLVSLRSQGVSVPSFLASQPGVSPFHALKIIALISFASAIIAYFTCIKIWKADTLWFFHIRQRLIIKLSEG